MSQTPPEASAREPLCGIRVVAVEQAVAGPLCTRHLSDLGAEVIKIERPGRGDFARGYDTLAYGMSTHYVWLNRGKRSVVLDLKSAPGRAALTRLLGSADVLVSNLGSSALARLVDLDEVRRDNPGLVSCSISGYGPDGPLARRKAFDLLVVGEAEVTANTGAPDAAAKPGVSLADLAGGIYAMAAICAALHERHSTGMGRHVDISLFDIMCEWMMPLLLAEDLSGTSVPPAGMRHATITPYGPYICADGAVLNIAVQTDEQWQRLCTQVLHDPALAEDAAFATNELRMRGRDQCERRVQSGIGRLDRSSLEAALDAADVPWGRLNGTRDVLAHEQLSRTNRWTHTALPGGELVQVLADPFRFAARGAQPVKAVAALGADTEQVLADLAMTRTPPET
jgi:crotonobetainyl-CoA:carnitine CoA-transferase CaiB-like acyl-CoA transferase